MDHDLLRLEILEAALKHVPFDGWTTTALSNGARDLGHGADMAVRAFPRGVPEALEAYLKLLDARMVERIEEMDLESMPVRERVAACVRARLEVGASEKEAIRLASAQLALPHQAPIAARALYGTVDTIWYACGDQATDWNFYSKRALLAGVYSSTLLYWLNDRSEDHTASWSFLDRRIADVMRLPKLLKSCRETAGRPLDLVVRAASAAMRAPGPGTRRWS